jgi:hypothetical protein
LGGAATTGRPGSKQEAALHRSSAAQGLRANYTTPNVIASSTGGLDRRHSCGRGELDQSPTPAKLGLAIR